MKTYTEKEVLLLLSFCIIVTAIIVFSWYDVYLKQKIIAYYICECENLSYNLSVPLKIF